MWNKLIKKIYKYVHYKETYKSSAEKKAPLSHENNSENIATMYSKKQCEANLKANIQFSQINFTCATLFKNLKNVLNSLCV